MHETGQRIRGQKGKLDQGAAIALLEGWLAKLKYQQLTDDDQGDARAPAEPGEPGVS